MKALIVLLAFLTSCVDSDDSTPGAEIQTCAEAGCPVIVGSCREHDECTCAPTPDSAPIVCTIVETP